MPQKVFEDEDWAIENHRLSPTDVSRGAWSVYQCLSRAGVVDGLEMEQMSWEVEDKGQQNESYRLVS